MIEKIPLKKLKKIFLIASLIFSPVIIYNLTAYLITGYADVFFSNLFGIQRPGATLLEPKPLYNFISLLTLLYDIYSPLVSLAFILAIIALFLGRKIKEEYLLLFFLFFSLLFFSLTAIRSYYFLFITVPFTLFLSAKLLKIPKIFSFCLITLLLIYSLFYSYNTNLNRNFTLAGTTSIDGAVILKHPINLHYSLAARVWVEEFGYKQLQKTLDSLLDGNDCLIVDDSLNQIAVRRYIGHHDAIKEYYLGQSYSSRYPRCPKYPMEVSGDIYLLTSKPINHFNLEASINDHLGNKRFFLYHLLKGYYS